MSAHCPGGHKLAEVKQGGDGRERKNRKMQCDCCQKIGLAHEFSGCRPCNYDICSSCLKKSQNETPVNVKELLGDTFYTKDNKKVGQEALTGKTILVYFWSHTCEICDAFGDALTGYYTEAKEKGCDIEVVAVTDTADDADDDEKEMSKSFNDHHGNWLTLPFDDEAGRHRLHDWAGELLGDSPSGCGPSLLVIDNKGMLVNKRALLAIGSGTNHIIATSWKSPVVGDLSCGPYANNSDVAMSKAIIVLAEECSVGVKRKLKETLTEASEELAKQQNPPLLFLGTKSGPCKGIRKDVFKALGNGFETWGRGWTPRAIRKWTGTSDKRCATPDTRPLMMMIDVSEFTDSDRHGFYVSNATLVTVDKIKSFLKEVEDEKVELKKFDFDNYEETFEPIPEEVNGADPKVQPLTGTVTDDGCYMGAGTWDDFGVEGIGGKITMTPQDDGSSSYSSSSDGEAPGADGAFSVLNQYRGSESSVVKKPLAKASPAQKQPPSNDVTLADRVIRLESIVDKQQHVIDQLLSRIKQLEGGVGGTQTGKKYFSLDEQLRQNFREQEQEESKEQSKGYHCEDDDETDSDDSEIRAYREKKAAQAGKPLSSREYTCEDDEDTDSDDSEVREYRAKMAAKNTTTATTTREYKNEDDDDTDSDDSEVRAYRLLKAANSSNNNTANTPSTKQEYKCEDDDDTDSEDSEVREYRAKKAAQAASKNNNPPEKKDTPAPEAAETEQEKAKDEPKSDPTPPSQDDGINKNEDWICPKCRNFNWGGVTDCVACNEP